MITKREREREFYIFFWPLTYFKIRISRTYWNWQLSLGRKLVFYLFRNIKQENVQLSLKINVLWDESEEIQFDGWDFGQEVTISNPCVQMFMMTKISWRIVEGGRDAFKTIIAAPYSNGTALHRLPEDWGHQLICLHKSKY